MSPDEEYRQRLHLLYQSSGSTPGDVPPTDDLLHALAFLSEQLPLAWASTEHAMPEGHAERCNNPHCGVVRAQHYAEAVLAVICLAGNPTGMPSDAFAIAEQIAVLLHDNALAAMGPRS